MNGQFISKQASKQHVKKISYAIIAIVFIVCLFFIAFFFDQANVESPFYIEFDVNENAKEKIELWEDDGEYYLFIPNNLKEYNVITNYEYILINNTTINDVDFKSFDNEVICPVMFGKYNKVLHILKTSNISTMYIDSYAPFERLENDKDYDLEISVSLYDADGNLNYSSTKELLKGRGNSTWDVDKKPFVLTLTNEESLLGMVNSNKYILLANAFDESNIKNKLVLDFAQNLNFLWSPHAEYVDLYIDGEYYGIYVLCEKITIDKYEYNDDSYLFHWATNIQKNDNYFISDSFNCFQVEYPQKITKGMKNDINLLEYSIINNDRWQDLIDMESFARKYLLEELFGNRDYWSLYFYYDGKKYYAEPVWDYDVSMGISHNMNRSPYLIEMNNSSWVSDDISMDGTWFYYLNQRKEFQNATINVYEKEFLPIVDSIENQIDEYEQLIYKSNHANSIRWHKMFRMYENEVLASKIKEYMEKRIDFVNDLINCADNYYRVNLKLDNINNYYTTIYGETLSEIVDFDNLYNLKDNVKFYYADTNEPIDVNAIIDTDLIIYTEDTTTVNDIKEGDGLIDKLNQYKKSLLATLLIILMIMFSIILAFVEWRNSHGKKV